MREQAALSRKYLALHLLEVEPDVWALFGHHRELLVIGTITEVVAAYRACPLPLERPAVDVDLADLGL